MKSIPKLFGIPAGAGCDLIQILLANLTADSQPVLLPEILGMGSRAPRIRILDAASYDLAARSSADFGYSWTALPDLRRITLAPHAYVCIQLQATGVRK